MTDVEPTSSVTYPQLRRIGESANDKASLFGALSAITENVVDRAVGLDSVNLAQVTPGRGGRN